MQADQSQKWKTIVKNLGINLALLVSFTFLLFPIFWVVTMAFKPNADIVTWPPKFIFQPTLDNFRTITLGAVAGKSVGSMTFEFMQGFLNSFVISALAVTISLIIGIPAAYALARFRFKGREEIAFTFLSFRFAPELLVIIPIFLIFQRIGLYDTYIGLIWVYQLITLPMIIWILRSYVEDIPRDLEHAGLVDGYPMWRVIPKVVLPLIKPGIAAAGLLSFIYAWNNFVFGFILGSSRVHPVTIAALKFMTVEKIRFGETAAGAVLAALPSLILSIYAQRYLVRGLSMGAVKK